MVRVAVLQYALERVPETVHEWHMAMYADAVNWVSLPNALGMSQYGDGGIVGTKPYCASGKYINKDGRRAGARRAQPPLIGRSRRPNKRTAGPTRDYCGGCRYDYRKKTGADACPFSTLYYDFLDRHGKTFAGNPRMAYQLRNLQTVRRKPETMRAIRMRAEHLRRQWVTRSS